MIKKLSKLIADSILVPSAAQIKLQEDDRLIAYRISSTSENLNR